MGTGYGNRIIVPYTRRGLLKNFSSMS
ncbi:hypothetical protein B4U80_01968 [Leptotrombidium deliense]|uniref:Uncharacterized protein n=1 Tax=Leptotrombidium deliense TaxID=299467 RepID=A0A443Q7M0_9ACAR|nr:hypothetical protein B4U80_01968 [Leptotrombidium deliense]